LLCHFLFNDPAPTEIYSLSLHDALPICGIFVGADRDLAVGGADLDVLRAQDVDQRRDLGHVALDREHVAVRRLLAARVERVPRRSEEHTSELQSLTNLVCRLLLEKKKRY